MWLEIDRTCYYPGDTVHGVVHVELESGVKVKEFHLELYGRERIDVVDPPVNGFLGHHNSLNPFYSRSLQFPKLNNLLWEPGVTSIPFQFELPADALPSFVGRYSSVVWILSGWLMISSGNNLFDQVFPRVLTVSPGAPVPFTAQGPVARPKFRLELARGLVQPGEYVRGTLTQLENARFSGLFIGLVVSEDSVANPVRKGSGDLHRTLNRWVGTTLPIERGLLDVTRSVAFELRVPSDSSTSYCGNYSRVYWNVSVLVKELIGGADFYMYAPFVLASKRRNPSTSGARIISGGRPGQTAMQASVPLFTPPIGHVESPAEGSVFSSIDLDLPSRILNMVDKAWTKNLVTITRELQLSTGGFVDLNTIKKLCDELVAHGRLGKVFDGHFYNYGLTPTPSSTP